MDYNLKPWAYEQERMTIWNAQALEADPGYIGLDGSPTVVTELAEAPTRERKRILLEGTSQEIARQLIKIFEELL
jgi:electron transfer flavoprotein alpha/beta subunit